MKSYRLWSSSELCKSFRSGNIIIYELFQSKTKKEQFLICFTRSTIFYKIRKDTSISLTSLKNSVMYRKKSHNQYKCKVGKIIVNPM